MTIAAWALVAALATGRGYEGPTAVASVELTPEVDDASVPAPRVPWVDVHTHPPRRTIDHGRVRARWGLDAAITAGTGIPVLVLNRWVGPQLPRSPLPGSPPELGRVDAIASDRYAPRASLTSDVLVALALAAAPLVSLVDGRWAAKSAPTKRPHAFAKRWASAVLIEAESVAIAALFTNVLKYAVGRPRPYTTLAEADVAERDRDDLRRDLRAAGRSHSFPSGHSALAFAAVTSLATILTLDAPPTRRAKVVVALAWSLGLLTAGTTAALRVVAGKHYPSDIVVGSVIGAATGVATPLLHARGRLRRRSR